MIVFNILFPVFIYVFIGWYLKESSFLPEEFFKGCNKLIFYIGLPAFLFAKIVTAEFSFDESLKISLAQLLVMLLSIITAYLTLLFISIPKQSESAFVQVAFRGNTALVGLPVISFAFTAVNKPHLINLAVIALAPVIPVWNIVTVLLLNLHSDGKLRQRGNFGTMILRTVYNPLVLSCLLGLAFAVTGLTLPKFILDTCSRLGGMTLPLALMAIGATLSFRKLKGGLFVPSAAAFIKILITPLLAYLLCRCMSLDYDSTFIVLVYCAAPTAVSAFVMTQQMGGDAELAAGGIVISTLFSAIPLIIIVALFL